MFKGFSNLDIDSAGSGGRYTVQPDFEWANGVVLWVANAYGRERLWSRTLMVANAYGGVLDAPECSNIPAGAVSSENS